MPDVTLTDATLDEIEARAKAATLGPWELRDFTIQPSEVGRASGNTGNEPIFRNPHVEVVTAWVHGQLQDKVPIPMIARGPFTIPDAFPYWRQEDAVFIAHARADVPALLAALRVSRARERRLAVLLNRYYGSTPPCGCDNDPTYHGKGFCTRGAIRAALGEEAHDA